MPVRPVNRGLHTRTTVPTLRATSCLEDAMKDAITLLREERATLNAKLEKLDAAIAEYEMWAEGVAGLLAGDTHDGADGTHPSDNGEQFVKDELTEQPSSIGEFENTVRSILAGAEHPYQRGPMLAAIQRAGINVGGKNPANTMGTRLSRMAGVINLRGYGYWLASRPYMAAGHDPDLGEDETIAEINRITGQADAPLIVGRTGRLRMPHSTPPALVDRKSEN